jgi:superfamily I DNA/RNA helicase
LIILNKEKEIFLRSKGRIILDACPGSGKTTAIAYKLNELLPNLTSKYSGVACLSFTNVAKNEINQKFKEISGKFIGYPHLVSTIDSFINQYITLHFGSAILFGQKRIVILENNSIIDEILQHNWNFIKKYKDFLWKFKPSTIEYSVDGKLYSTYGTSSNGDFEKYCKEVKKFQFTRGMFKNSDSSYLALEILRRHNKVAKWLIQRFPIIMIDEAQDTSEIHHNIFDTLVENDLENIEYIGDPYQCLYEWRDAKPDLFINKFADKENWQGLNFTENIRSTQKIVDAFSIVRKKDDPKIKSILSCDPSGLFPIFVYKYKSEKEIEIIKLYEEFCIRNNFDTYQVVVRGNSLKYKLLGRKNDAYPWNSGVPYEIVRCKNEYDSKNIKTAIDKIRNLYIAVKYSEIEFIEKKRKENELKLNNELNSSLFAFIKEIPDFELSINDWTTETQSYFARLMQLSHPIDFDIKKKNSKHFDKRILHEKMSFHFSNSTTKGMPITTVHQVKGITLDSIMLVLNEKKHKENITFSEIEVSEGFPNEKKRLLYVAMSRPRFLLSLGIHESISDEEIYTKFGKDCNIVK